jgi:hypothetical protein
MKKGVNIITIIRAVGYEVKDDGTEIMPYRMHVKMLSRYNEHYEIIHADIVMN